MSLDRERPSAPDRLSSHRIQKIALRPVPGPGTPDADETADAAWETDGGACLQPPALHPPRRPGALDPMIE